MGGAASKKAATTAASSVAKAAATAASTQATTSAAAAAAAPRVVQTTLTRDEIVGVAAAGSAKGASMASVVRNPKAAPQIELIEMNSELLREMDQFQGFEEVSFLQQDTSAFRNTASSYRVRSSEPISMPTDRTSNAANIDGIYEKMEGRVTNRDMRFLLRLHYEDPEKWDADALAAHFDVDAKVLKNVLAHVGPPNVLKPLGPLEHPLGIWYDSPQAAAAMVPEYSAPEQLPASSSPSSATQQQ
jgi:hypothetical protein